MKKSFFVGFFALMILLLSGCFFQKNYENFNNAGFISGGRDSSFYKINSELALWDDLGGASDRIRWAAKDMKAADDAVNYGTECCSGVFDRIYCGDDYVVAKLVRFDKNLIMYNEYIVIDCKKPQEECISSYDDPNEIGINYLDYPVIQCCYPKEWQ